MAKRKQPEDPQARAVLEALAGIARCPDCSSTTYWRMVQGHKAAHCNSSSKICRVIYYRPDGYCIRMEDEPDNFTGVWTWSR